MFINYLSQNFSENEKNESTF